jgi:hypothetical protein
MILGRGGHDCPAASQSAPPLVAAARATKICGPRYFPGPPAGSCQEGHPPTRRARSTQSAAAPGPAGGTKHKTMVQRDPTTPPSPCPRPGAPCLPRATKGSGASLVSRGMEIWLGSPARSSAAAPPRGNLGKHDGQEQPARDNNPRGGREPVVAIKPQSLPNSFWACYSLASRPSATWASCAMRGARSTPTKTRTNRAAGGASTRPRGRVCLSRKPPGGTPTPAGGRRLGAAPLAGPGGREKEICAKGLTRAGK